ncbi:MAG: GNAT family N-acetyltransferase [Actinomycetes bacterium]
MGDRAFRNPDRPREPGPHRLRRPVAEVGYWVLPDHRRQGVASTAVEAAEMHAFNDVGIVRLFIRHEPDNVASCALADSRGYQPEGVQRGAFTRAGARRDLHVHGLLATDGQ